MNGKIEITATIVVKTGLHIGGTEGFSAIGAIDNEVIKDALTGRPIIPGSSLKGKLRSLIAQHVLGHEGELRDDPPEVVRLFGAMSSKSRLQFADCFIVNEKQPLTEMKTETAIDRKKGSAQNGSLRISERVTAGQEFKFSLIYNADVEEEIVDDLNKVFQGIKILEYDYLGGSGTRGYGRVNFKELSAQVVSGSLDIEKWNQKIQEICDKVYA